MIQTLRAYFVLSLTVVVLLCLPSFALAQSHWISFNDAKSGWRGASVCPVNDAQTGNFYCFSVACSGNGPVQFLLSIAGGDLPDRMIGQVLTDNRPIATLAFSRTQNRNFFEYTAPYQPRKHSSLLSAMKTGTWGGITLNAPGATSPQMFSLRGSSNAIASAMNTCPLPAPPAITDPAKTELMRVQEMCSKVNGGTVIRREGLAQQMDFDGDGLQDMLINLGAAECTTMRSLNCGSGGCERVFYRQLPDATYVRLGSITARGVSVKTRTLIEMNLHGSACGLVGAAPCKRSFVVKGSKLVPLDNSRN